MTALTDLLREVEIFSQASEETVTALAEAAATRFLATGAFLYRQGDDADSLAIVESGRLEIAFENDPGQVAAVARRGDVLGELSFLARRPRAAAVRATRDSVVHVVTHAAFESILQQHPELGIAIARNLGERLRTSSGRDLPKHRPSVFTLIAADADLDVSAVALRLTRCIPTGVIGRSADLPVEDSDRAAWLDTADADGATVFLVADDTAAGWNDFCLRSADRVLVVSRGAPSAVATGDARLRARDLVVLDGPISAARLAACRRSLAPATCHLIRSGHVEADTARAARRLTGRAIGLVLSGGGARALAHIGVAEALAAAGVTFDRIGGCSMGGLVGALLAQEWPAPRIAAAVHDELRGQRRFANGRLLQVSLFRSERARRMVDRLFGATRIEELPLPFFCVSSDLASGDLVAHRDGTLAPAVAASMAIPGVLHPVRHGDAWLVDGGMLDNLPVDVMTADGEGPVVAVDVMRGAGRVGRAAAPPSRLETVVRSSLIGSFARSERNRDAADVLITPDVSAIGLLDFDRAGEAIAIGRRAGEAAAHAVRRLSA